MVFFFRPRGFSGKDDYLIYMVRHSALGRHAVLSCAAVNPRPAAASERQLSAACPAPALLNPPQHPAPPRPTPPPLHPNHLQGKDKYENEDLIKYALPQDIWFHVSQLSSAHVYLRLPPGVAWDSGIPPDTLEDCAQLVKANSIGGPLGGRAERAPAGWLAGWLGQCVAARGLDAWACAGRPLCGLGATEPAAWHVRRDPADLFPCWSQQRVTS